MAKAMPALLQFVREEDGVTSIEYALTASLIAVVCFVTVAALGDNVRTLYIKVCNDISTAISGAPAC